MANQGSLVRMAAETLRTLAFGSISSSYTALGAPFANPSRIFMIVNTTDVLLTFSLNGTSDHFVLPSGSQMVIDISGNLVFPSAAFYIPQGQVFYVKGSPGLGAVYLTTFFGSETL